jgi:hypothetical protein
MKRTKLVFAALLVAAMAGGLQAGAGKSATKEAAQATQSYDKPGYVAFEQDGRLWVFPEGSEAATRYSGHEKPEKHVTRVSACIDRATIKSVEAQTLNDFIATNDHSGFVMDEDEEGRLWVFKKGSEAAGKYVSQPKPEKHVTQIGACLERKTVKALNQEDIEGYLRAR